MQRKRLYFIGVILRKHLCTFLYHVVKRNKFCDPHTYANCSCAWNYLNTGKTLSAVTIIASHRIYKSLQRIDKNLDKSWWKNVFFFKNPDRTWRTPTPTLLRLVLILAILLHSWVPPTDMSRTFWHMNYTLPEVQTMGTLFATVHISTQIESCT